MRLVLQWYQILRGGKVFTYLTLSLHTAGLKWVRAELRSPGSRKGLSRISPRLHPI